MSELKEIDMDKIKVSKSNTRKDLESGTEDAGINELAQSIQEKGLISPITVMKADENSYEIIAGQRRYLACKKLGKRTISAIVRENMDDIDATIISLIENVHRADMNPMDKAKAFKKIYEKYKEYEKASKEVGLTIPTIKRYLKLLDLSPSLQNAVTTKDGFAGIETLSKVASIFDMEDQEKAMDMIGGFKQQIQVEMIKRSGGNLDNLGDLKEQALEGAFDTKLCRGLQECLFLNDEEIELIEKYRLYKESITPDENIDEDFISIVKKIKRGKFKQL